MPASLRWGTSSGWGTAARSSSTPSRSWRGRWNWNSQLWSIAYPAGALRRITPNDASYLTAAATKDGRTLVTIRDELRASLWVAPDGDSTRARPITRSSTGREGAVGIEWTLDGRIVYAAAGHDHWDLWIAKSDGSEPRQLTNDGGAQPQLRPDGTGLFFLATGGPATAPRFAPWISTAAMLDR